MRVLFVISLLMLGACAGPPESLPTVWARADGQPINSGLLDIDGLDCRDGLQKPSGAAQGNSDKGNADKGAARKAMVDDFVSCMKDRGYVQPKG